MRGKFIVIEGGDGAGKDTQIELLKKELGEEKYLFVKDPGSTNIGTKIREIVLHNEGVTKNTEFLLYLAARTQMVEEKILPALERGVHVISNRFSPSTIAYQIYGRERTDEYESYKRMSDFAVGKAIPDLVIYLDCPPEIGLTRVHQTGEKVDRFEKEQLAFHERVREGYLSHLSEYHHVRIDATEPIQRVLAEVLGSVQQVTTT